MFESNSLSLILAWLFSIPIIAGAFALTIPFIWKKHEQVPRAFTIWLGICFLLISPYRYIIFQVVTASSYMVQSFTSFLVSAFLLSLYVPIVFLLMFGIGIALPFLIISFVIGNYENPHISKLWIASVALPFILAGSTILYFWTLPFAAKSIHWLSPVDVIRATNGPSYYAFHYFKLSTRDIVTKFIQRVCNQNPAHTIIKVS